ncbi:MAG TPA: cytochrome c3 family protein [Deltaproteobacteria bacterium]|nr:cytochrome c3 family protein [Deltaproteobacteria bacterium]
MKIRVLTAILFTAILIFGISVFSQEDVVTVEDSAFTERMRPPVPFKHDEHNETAGIDDCAVCHHQYEDGKLVEGESSEDKECSECHASEGDSYPISLVKAYHINCKRCHLEKKSGPVMCAECHPRN